MYHILGGENSVKCIAVFERKAVSILNQLCLHRKDVIADTQHYFIPVVNLVHRLGEQILQFQERPQKGATLQLFFKNSKQWTNLCSINLILEKKKQKELRIY